MDIDFEAPDSESQSDISLDEAWGRYLKATVVDDRCRINTKYGFNEFHSAATGFSAVRPARTT